jgi:hypothetical protein
MDKSLDLDVEQVVQAVINTARRSGASVPHRLNTAGLLFTKERELRARNEALEDLLMEFRVWMPHEFLRLVNRELTGCTPTDMWHAIGKWLEDYVAYIKKSA